MILNLHTEASGIELELKIKGTLTGGAFGESKRRWSWFNIHFFSSYGINLMRIHVARSEASLRMVNSLNDPFGIAIPVEVKCIKY